MSQENVEIVTRAMRAAFAQPGPDYATMNELYSPDHVLVPAGVATGLEQEARGAEGYRAWRDGLQEFIGAQHELQSVEDLGADKVLAVTRTQFEGRASGVASEQRIWNLLTVVDGRVVRTEAFTARATALEAARLSE